MPSADDLYQPRDNPPPPSARLGFKWSTLPARTAAMEAWHTIFAHPHFPADRLTVGFTNLLTFPRNVAVTGKECGVINAWYSKKDGSITFCYELASFFYKAFRATKDRKAAMTETVHSLMFVELHEMGHALIGELDLGVAGGEEEAVDDFAAVVLAKSAPSIVTDGAVAMAELGKLSKKPKYFDEHPVGDQRFYNIYCVIYGSDPQKWKGYVDHPLPSSRAAGCPDEYRKKKKYWEQQLTPFGFRW